MNAGLYYQIALHLHQISRDLNIPYDDLLALLFEALDQTIGSSLNGL